MTAEPTTADFDLDAAKRVLGDVFAPWVQDLKLTLDRIETEIGRASCRERV